MSAPLRVLMTTAPREVSRVVVPGQLYATVALRQGEHVVPVRRPDLEVLEATPVEAWRRAVALVRRTTVRKDLLPVDTLPGLFQLAAGDGLAASRLLVLPELLAPLPFGGLLAAVPAASQLFVAPLASSSGLDALQTLAITATHAHETADDPLSPHLFWYDGTAWRLLRVTCAGDEVTVRPPKAFFDAVSGLAAMDLVRTVGEA